MAAPDLKGFLQVGFDILASRISDKTKRLVFQLGSVESGTADSDDVESWQQYGMVSRPPKPDTSAKTATQAVVLRAGDHDIALATTDSRGLQLYGQLDYGEVAIYSAGSDGKGQARALLKKDGSVNLYTKVGNVDGGAGMLIQLDAKNNAVRALNGKGFGIIIDADGVTITAGAAALELKASGDINLVGTGKTVVDGASVTAGASATAGAVLTQTSTLPLFTAIAGLTAALVPFASGPLAALSGGTGAPVAAAATTVTPLLALPTTFSQKTGAG